MNHNYLRYSFERNGCLVGSDMFLQDIVESLNLRDMFLLRCAIQVYSDISHLHMQRFKLSIRMYARDFEFTLQVYLVDLFNYIFNVLYFSIFNHASFGKYDLSGYGVQEDNAVDVHEVTSQGEFIVFVKYVLGYTCYHNRLHMLNLVPDRFALKMWHTGSIDVLSHPGTFSQNWEVLQDFMIN